MASLVGGTASSLGGGKFANGAITAAFSRAFNDEMHNPNDRSFLSRAKSALSAFEVRVGSAMGLQLRTQIGGARFAIGPKVSGGFANC